MNINYIKDYKHNYMVIKDNRVIENNYQLKMLTLNNIDGLLPCQERMINGEGLLYYEVTSMHSLDMIFDNRCVNMEDLRNIFKAIEVVCEGMEHYLLREENLILTPESVYMDIESKECRFIYYPFYDRDVENPFLEFINYLLERINNEEIMAVEAIYKLADIVSKHQMNISQSVKWFNKEYEEIPKEKYPVKHREEFNIDDNDFFKDDEDFEEELSWFDKIKRWFSKKDDKDDEDLYFEEVKVQNISKEADTSEGTVYIPWVENTEGKLYGIGPNNKYHIELAKVPLTIGKLSGMVDMVLSENSISRMHAKIFRQGSRYLMQDLNSTNGSYKNGIRLSPNEIVSIEPGDEIGFGKLKFVYR